MNERDDVDDPLLPETRSPVYTGLPGIAVLIAQVLSGAGPLGVKGIKRALRDVGQPRIKISAINKTLRTEMSSIVTQEEGKWRLVLDSKFWPPPEI